MQPLTNGVVRTLISSYLHRVTFRQWLRHRSRTAAGNGVVLKLTRAHEHLLNLESDLDYYLNSKPHRLEVEIRQHKDGSHFYVVPKWILERPPPERVSALVGDLIHNLRGALDHLACALVKAHTGKDCLTGPGGTQFPIFTTPTNDNGNPRVVHVNGGVSSKALALIRGLQPYVLTPNYPESDPLSIVGDLDNADKHHSLNVVACYLGGGKLDLRTPDGSVINVPLTPGLLRDGETEVAACRVDGSYEPVVEVEAEGTIGISLEPGPWGDEHVRPLMERLLNYVARDVVEPLADCL